MDGSPHLRALKGISGNSTSRCQKRQARRLPRNSSRRGRRRSGELQASPSCTLQTATGTKLGAAVHRRGTLSKSQAKAGGAAAAPQAFFFFFCQKVSVSVLPPADPMRSVCGEVVLGR